MAISRTRICVAAALAAMAALPVAQAARAAAPTLASAGQTVRSAGAEFDSTTSGCVQTHVDVQGQEALTGTFALRPAPGADATVTHDIGPRGFLRVQQWGCDGTQLIDAFGPPCCDQGPPLEGLTIARDLTSASLHTTFIVHDSISDSDKAMAVDLAWTAIPPLTRGHFKINDNETSGAGGVDNVNVNDVGTGYGAAVSGSVSDGTNAYGPDTLDNAFISKDVSHFLHVGF